MNCVTAGFVFHTLFPDSCSGLFVRSLKGLCALHKQLMSPQLATKRRSNKCSSLFSELTPFSSPPFASLEDERLQRLALSGLLASLLNTCRKWCTFPFILI